MLPEHINTTTTPSGKSRIKCESCGDIEWLGSIYDPDNIDKALGDVQAFKELHLNCHSNKCIVCDAQLEWDNKGWLCPNTECAL